MTPPETLVDRLTRLLHGPRGPVDPFDNRSIAQDLQDRAARSAARGARPDAEPESHGLGGLQQPVWLRDDVHVMVDLLGGPILTLGAPTAKLEPYTPRAQIALRGLALAETRHAQAPAGPWPIDAALHAIALLTELSRADAPLIAGIAETRASEAVSWLREVPDQIFVREAVMSRARLEHVLQPLSTYLHGTPAGASLEAFWGELEAAVPPRPAPRERQSLGEPLVLATQVRTMPLPPALYRSGLVDADALLELWDDNGGMLTATIPIRSEVARAHRDASSGSEMLARFAAVELQALLPAGRVIEPWLHVVNRGSTDIDLAVLLALDPVEPRFTAAVPHALMHDNPGLVVALERLSHIDLSQFLNEAVIARPSARSRQVGSFLLLMTSTFSDADLLRATQAVFDGVGGPPLERLEVKRLLEASAGIRAVRPIDVSTVASELRSAVEIESEIVADSLLKATATGRAAVSAGVAESSYRAAREGLDLLTRLRRHI